MTNSLLSENAFKNYLKVFVTALGKTAKNIYIGVIARLAVITIIFYSNTFVESFQVWPGNVKIRTTIMYF